MEESAKDPNTLRAVGIAGAPFPSSKSRAIVERALTHFRDLGCETDLIVVGDLPADALLSRAQSPEMQAAVATLARATVVVVGTPVYKATFCGSLKVFIDNLPQRSMAGKVAIPVATGGSPNHLLALDHGLRPLLANEGAVATARGVYAVDSEFQDGQPNEAVATRILTAVTEAVALAHGLRALLTDDENV